MSDVVMLSREDLAEMMELVAKTVASEFRRKAGLPRLYAFPDDIAEILGGRVQVSTIRSWKTAGYLRTIPIGAKSFVKPEDWEWFIANHKHLMAASPQSRGRRFTEKREAADAVAGG